MESKKEDVILIVDPITSKDYGVQSFKEKNIKVVAIFTVHQLCFFSTFKQWSDEQVFSFIEKEIAECEFDEIVFQWNYGAQINVFEYLKKYNVVCVVNALEYSVEFTNQLANFFGVSDNSQTSVRLLQSKYELNEFCRNEDISVPFQLLVNNLETFYGIREKICSQGFPIFAKPSKGCGTIDAQKLNSLEELEEYMARAKNFPIILQEFLVGVEYAIDVVSYNGEQRISGIFRYKKDIVDGYPVYDYMDIMPESETTSKQLVAYVKEILNVIGWSNGLSHVEVILTERGPMLVEVNGRASGGRNFINKLAKHVRGKDQFTILSECIFESLKKSEKIELQQQGNLFGKMVIINNYIQDRVMGTFKYEKLKELPSYKEGIVFPKQGDKLAVANDLATAVGYVILVHEKQEKVEEDYKNIIYISKNGGLF